MNPAVSSAAEKGEALLEVGRAEDVVALLSQALVDQPESSRLRRTSHCADGVITAAASPGPRPGIASCRSQTAAAASGALVQASYVAAAGPSG